MSPPAARPGNRLRRAAPIYMVLAILACLVAGGLLRADWQRRLFYPGIAGDGLHYWHLAVHIDRDHTISQDGKTPSWTRLPGYPIFLALTTQPGISDTGPQTPIAIRDRVYAWLARLKRVNLAVDLLGGLLAMALALALGAGRFSLLALAWWAVQPWTSVVAVYPLSDSFATTLTAATLAVLARAMGTRRARDFILAGVLGGLGQWVRSDAMLLLPAIGGGALLVGATLRDRLRLAAVALAAYALVFVPWPARNLALFGRPYLLGGNIGIDKDGRPLDRTSAFTWMRSWCSGREEESVRVAWRFPSQPVSIDDVPPQAYDSPAERAELASILAGYNRKGAVLDAELSARLDALSAARRAAHPFRHWVRLPVERIVRRLFPPRDGFGLGALPAAPWMRPVWVGADSIVVLAGLAGLVLLARRRSWRPFAIVLGGWLALRAVAVTVVMPAPEPRYFLEILPLLGAGAAVFAAQIPSLFSRQLARDQPE